MLVKPGLAGGVWQAAANDDEEGGPQLVAVAPGEKVSTDEILVKALVTKPPARFNEATLLSAMEGAGKMVDDEELRAAMAGRGLGTRPPAPRSSRT